MKRDDDWNYIYSLAVEYRNKYGNLIIPSSYITEQGVNLGRWISTQRNLYKNNRLSEERVKKLEEIGMIWTVCDQKWEEMYKLAQKYHEENGNLLIIKEYVIEEKKLGSWIYKQRSLYQEKKLSEERIKKLEKIGMVWDVHDEKWEEMYDLAKKYYLKYNNLLIKDYVIINGVKLGRWIRYQRKQYKARKLSEERIKKLEEIGMVWGIVSKDNYITKENELKWEEMYKLAQKYCEENGNLLVPQSYVTCDGQKLGNWICVQRCFYQNQTLNKNREKLLNKIGMIWDIHDFKWESSYDAARKYYEENGNLFVPNDYMTEYGINLVNWLNSQKVLYRDKKLKKERIEKLNQIGIIWDIHESRWEEMYQLAVDYYMENGNLLVPSDYIKNGYNLNCWINRQKSLYAHKKLSEEKIKRLNKIGIIWNLQDEKWERMYNLAREYYIIHKDLFIVGKYMTDKGVNLGYWISTQRELYKKNKLSEERIKKLEEIGMIWNIYDMRWENVYKLAKEFFDKNHHLLIPQNYVVNNINLGNWIMYQRELYNKKRIIKERVKKLEEIGMVWDPSNFITITSRNQRRIKLKLLEDMKELLQDYDNISSKDTINEINKKMLLSSR